MKEINLWPHQIEALNKIDKVLENNDKAHVIMFCGTGKTRTFLHTVINRNEYLTTIIVPGITLITQFINDYINNVTWSNITQKFKYMFVCSRNELNDKSLNYTTTIEEIESFINMDSRKIIICTYQSLGTLAKSLHNTDRKINLMIYDEAHHIVGNQTREYVFCNNSLKAKKTLFFTATPKNENGIIMYNDGKKTDCGAMAFYFSHRNAVDRNICNDFEIAIDMFTNMNNNKSRYEYICQAIARSILKTGNSRMLIFHGYTEKKSDRRSNVTDFVTNQNIFLKEYHHVLHTEFNELKDKYKKITIKGITAKTTNRPEILKAFDESPDNEIYILSSCNTLSEGVDTKKANHLCFFDSKNSPYNIKQNIGRITRKPDKNIPKSTVLIPCYMNASDYLKCNTNEERDNIIRENMRDHTNDFNGILNVLATLEHDKRHDITDIRKMKTTSQQHKNTNNADRNKVIDRKWKYNITTHCTTDIKILFELNDDIDMTRKIYQNYVKSKIIKITFEEMYNKLQDFVTDNDKLPVKNNNNQLYNWCSARRLDKKNNKLSDDHINKLEKIKYWYWTKNEKITISQRIIQTLNETNKKMASSEIYNSISDEEIKILCPNGATPRETFNGTCQKLCTNNIIKRCENDNKINNKNKSKWLYYIEHNSINQSNESNNESNNDPTDLNNVNNYPIDLNNIHDTNNGKSIDFDNEGSIDSNNVGSIDSNDDLDSMELSDVIYKNSKIIKKSIYIQPYNDSDREHRSNCVKLTKYRKISRKMSHNHSTKTATMFKNNPNKWLYYHNIRDNNMLGYEENPIDIIINRLEMIANHQLKILDLGCGRNYIASHFKENNRFVITGYDHVSYNGSKVVDISNLPDDDYSIDICIFSLSLMGSNWKEYINEAYRVLKYRGEMLIADIITRYDSVVKCIKGKNMRIIHDEHGVKRWFYLYAVKE